MKRRLKLAISLLLRAWDIVHDAGLRLAGRPGPARCMVLYYHAVPAKHRELFARQLDRILELARPIPADFQGPLAASQRYVSVTFDDGFISVAENAAPELAKRRIPWTIFVPSGRIGQKPDWLRQAHPAAREDRVMTAEELRSLARDPAVTIGSHTVGHINLLEVDPARAAAELADSKKQLETLLGTPVTHFSYPFGGRDGSVDAQARAAGYTHIFCSEPTFAEPSTLNPQLSTSASDLRSPTSDFNSPPSVVRLLAPIGRASVDPDMSPLEFRLKLLGAYRWQARIHRSAEPPMQ